MKQIFEFDQSEICDALLQHISQKLGYEFSNENMDIRVTLPDDTVEYLNGRIQLIIGGEDE